MPQQSRGRWRALAAAKEALIAPGCATSALARVGPEIRALAACFRLFNRLFYWFIGRFHPFLLPLFCYAYLTRACNLQVIYWREPKNSEIIILSL